MRRFNVERALKHVASFDAQSQLEAALARRGVQATTLASYAANLKPLLVFVAAKRGTDTQPQDVTREDFAAFAEACREQGIGDIVKAARVALAEVQRAYGVEEWARADRVIFLTAAAAYDAGEADGVLDNAGTLSDSMLEELLALCPAAWMNTAIHFIVALSLRVSQAEAALVGDYDVIQRSLQIAREDDKRDKRDARAPKVHSKRCFDDQAHAMIVAEVTGKAANEPLLPRKVAHSLRTLMKNAARVFEWPQELDYAGAHVLAHTGVRRLRDTHPNMEWKDFATLIAKSESMARKYAEPIEQRIARLQKAQKKRGTTRPSKRPRSPIA